MIDEKTAPFKHTKYNCIRIDPSTLNEEQKLAYDIVTKHHQTICCHTTNPIENEAATNPEQLLMIIYGTAGTGKSYLIDAIASQLKHDCCITATTGIAAFNINGVTIHSLLQLPIRNQGAKDLEGSALIRLQDRLKNKKYIIIDEMSMLGQRSFTWIDKRLRQATARYDKLFGGISVILIGDFGQLPPVGDKLLFTDPDVTKHESNDHAYLLYKQFTTVVILKQILRQSNTANEFRELLLTIRNGNISNEIWQALLSRSPSCVSNVAEFENSTHLFFDKQSVAEHNLKALQKLGNPIARIEAVNSDHAAKVTTSDEAGGLDSVVYISKNSKVMLTSNLWQQTGLCNGATGTVQEIFYANNHNPPSLPVSVLIDFGKYKGPPFLQDHPTWVPIPPVTFEWTCRYSQTFTTTAATETCLCNDDS
jgi:ATP-dependent DNA helicase PIF1